MRAVILGVVLVLSILFVGTQLNDGSRPAEASFHEMRIYGVMGGEDGDTGVQFVELRLASVGQSQVQQAQLCIYDDDGDPWARFVFPNAVSSGTSNASILVGTEQMESEWNAGGATVDFKFSAANTTAINPFADVTAPIPVPAGKILFKSKSDTTCTGTAPIDSLAYGTAYAGTVNFGTKFNQDLPAADSQGFQLTETPVDFPPSDNSTEYAVVSPCITARNNAGVSGTIGTNCAPIPTPTPGPTVTPVTATPAIPTPTTPGATVTSGTATPPATVTPTPTPAIDIPQGDADCDGNVDNDDSIVILEEEADVGEVPCPERANVNCDEFVDMADALRLFLHVADIRSEISGCTPIEEPLPL